MSIHRFMGHTFFRADGWHTHNNGVSCPEVTGIAEISWMRTDRGL